MHILNIPKVIQYIEDIIFFNSQKDSLKMLSKLREKMKKPWIRKVIQIESAYFK